MALEAIDVVVDVLGKRGKVSMNAEALLGTVLGTCTLQSLIGQGGMGTVFLAQQSRPNRQVAVKVLLPKSPLTPNQHEAFLERFRRETDAAASLVHPNIMPVHEYGERDGLAYIVMPYISGGTLRDEMERNGRLSLAKAVNYLSQLADAVDMAHERGVIHRDIKPANILITPEGRLVLADFGLVKVVSEGGNAHSRLTADGVPMGSPDYMAPEQVIGKAVDGRADIYSLGVLLYHMVTGTTPFKGDMPMQVAVQHLHTPPPSPRSLRPDLPVAAEQVILRAIAKQPVDRYIHAQDMSHAFRLALLAAGVPLEDPSAMTATREQEAATPLFPRRGLLSPLWQTNATGFVGAGQAAAPLGGNSPAAARVDATGATNDIVAKTHVTLPSFTDILAQTNANLPTPRSMKEAAEVAQPAEPNEFVQPAQPVQQTPIPSTTASHATPSKKPLKRTGLLRSVETESTEQPASPQTASMAPRPTRLSSFAGGTQADASEQRDMQRAEGTMKVVPPAFGGLGAPRTLQLPPLEVSQQQAPASPPPAAGTRKLPELESTGQADAQTMQFPGTVGYGHPQGGAKTVQLPESDYGAQGSTTTYGAQGSTTTMSLLPVDGNTGMLKLPQPMKVVQVPVAGQPGRYVTGLLPMLPPAEPLPSEADVAELSPQERLRKNVKLFVLIAAVALVLIGSVSFFLLAAQPEQAKLASHVEPTATPNLAATVTAQAQATVDANTVLSDPLTQNVHNWPVSGTGAQLYAFKDGTYHITNNDTRAAIALLPDEEMTGARDSFTYTLSLQEIGGNDDSIDNQLGVIVRYSTRQNGGKKVTTFYCFDVASAKAGGEYQFWKYDDSVGGNNNPWTKLWHQDLSPDYHFGHKNTFKVIAKGNKYTFAVNGKQVGDTQDGALSGGQVGMLVNLKGTEVAFSDLMLAYK